MSPKLQLWVHCLDPDKEKLLIDPTRILISREVAAEMSAIYERSELEIGGEISSHVAEHFESIKNEPYYSLMTYLLSLEACSDELQVERLRQIFKPEVKQDWDYNIGYSKKEKEGTKSRNRGSPSAQARQTASVQGGEDRTANRGGPISAFNQTGDSAMAGGVIPEANEEGDQDDYKLTAESKGRRIEERNSPSRVLSMQPGPAQSFDRSRAAKQVVSQVEFGKPGESELNSLLRRKMSQLIVKFLDAVIDEDPKIENKTQTKTKLHAIVNRKCQNLLTSVFSTEKNQFQKLLMMKVDSTKDAISVDEIFDRYQIIKSEGMENLADKKATDFLKGMLKMDKLAGQISNLIMYSTTPLEEIVRFR